MLWTHCLTRMSCCVPVLLLWNTRLFVWLALRSARPTLLPCHGCRDGALTPPRHAPFSLKYHLEHESLYLISLAYLCAFCLKIKDTSFPRHLQ